MVCCLGDGGHRCISHDHAGKGVLVSQSGHVDGCSDFMRDHGGIGKVDADIGSPATVGSAATDTLARPFSTSDPSITKSGR